MEINDEKQNNFKIEKVEKVSSEKVNRSWKIAKYFLEFGAWGILQIVTLIGQASCANAYQITKDTGLIIPIIMGLYPFALSVERMKEVIYNIGKVQETEFTIEKDQRENQENLKDEQECQLVKKK